MNSQNTGVLGRSGIALLEAAKRTVSRSFLCLVFVVSQVVMPAELSCVICGGIVLLPQVYVRVYACVCERCSLFNNLIIIIVIIIIIIIIIIQRKQITRGRYITKHLLPLTQLNLAGMTHRLTTNLGHRNELSCVICGGIVRCRKRM